VFLSIIAERAWEVLMQVMHDNLCMNHFPLDCDRTDSSWPGILNQKSVIQYTERLAQRCSAVQQQIGGGGVVIEQQNNQAVSLLIQPVKAARKNDNSRTSSSFRILSKTDHLLFSSRLEK